jgi:hypothetical protein
MEHLLDEVASDLERLTVRINELESRVSKLEHPAAVASVSPKQSPAIDALHSASQPTLSQSSVSMPAVGRVFLGIAGAYVLRAIAESSPLPQLVAVAVALVYAAIWLVWAARTRADIFVSTAYSVTAALILAPMLWEVTLRFQVLPAEAAAGVLVGFVALGSALAWRRNLTTLMLVVGVCATTTAITLMVATRKPASFIVALVAMVLITEVSAFRGRLSMSRPVVAAVCDLALLILLSIYTDAAGLSPEYRPLPSMFLLTLLWALLLIYAAATAYRTLALRQEIGYFEIVQTVVAFLLAFIGTLRLTHHAAAPWLGAFCLAGALAAYAALITFQHRFQLQPRAYHVFAIWAVALSLTGALLAVPAGTRAILWGIAGVIAVVLGRWTGRLTLGFHGVIYIAGAVVASGLLNYGGRALAGRLPAAPNWQVAFTAALAMASYFISTRTLGRSFLQEVSLGHTGDEWKHNVQRTCFSVIVIFAVLALMVVPLAATASPLSALSLPLVAIVRTLVLCLAALALTLGGTRWKRPELVWTGYAVIAFCTLKLLFEDLRNGSAVSIAISLFLYGMVWVLVPRMVRMSQRRT